MGAGGQASGAYEIDQSIRFNDDDSSHLSKTFGSAGNRKTWTLSWWVKRGNLGIRTQMFAVPYALGVGQFIFEFGDGDGGDPADNKIIFNNEAPPAAALNWDLDWAFRDPAAWYHFVAIFDTTQSTANNRFKVYINGAEVTEGWDRNSTPDQNTDYTWNNALEHKIGGRHYNTVSYFDGYMAEIHFIDGTAKAATDFGEYDSNGVWIPKEYSGSYGTTGFFIDGRDSSDLGDDESGNGNDFSSSGLTAADQKPDTPTLNASTLNPLWAGATLSDGNLVATATGNNYQWAISTFAVDDGNKHVVEFQKSSGTFGYVGLYQLGNHTATTGNNYFYGYNLGTGEIVKNSSVVTDLGTGAANSLMRIEYDSSNDTIEIFDDGTEIFPASTGVSNTVGLTGHNSLHFGCSPYASGTIITATFQGLSGTPTTDFKELTSANLAAPTIKDGTKYFQTTLYTGNGSTQSINQSGNSTFQPDFAWIKGREIAVDHALYDALRGATKEIKSNTTDAEATITNGLTAFESDGFALGDRIGVNADTEPFVVWQWLANGSGSSNTDGSINTTATSANTTAGFSISTYTGTGSAATIGHGLGVTPSMILVKKRDSGSDDAWVVWHTKLPGANYYLNLNDTGAKDTSVNYWNNTLPTSSVFSVGASNGTNQNTKTFVAYCFAEVAGYSSIGSYEGNGNADGSFIYTGFRPSWLLIKNIDAAESWNLRDNKRDLFNVTKEILVPNTNAAEATSGGGQYADLLSNGFKLRGTDPGVNSSATFIYMAFAENPFGGSGIAPVTAR